MAHSGARGSRAASNRGRKRFERQPDGVAMSQLQRRTPWPGEKPERDARLISREWLVTNGLGGYASGTVSGVITRGFHGYLVPALPSPWGRTMMLNDLVEEIELPGGDKVQLGGEERVGVAPRLNGAEFLSEFRLDLGLPVWRYEVGDAVIEKSLVMPRGQNTVYVNYRMLSGDAPLRLSLRPLIDFRPHNSPVTEHYETRYTLAVIQEDEYEVTALDTPLPPLRIVLHGQGCALTVNRTRIEEVLYRIEQSRGYASRGSLWSLGQLHVKISRSQDATLVASTEDWTVIRAMTPAEALDVEQDRRRRLLDEAGAGAPDETAAELVLAADQFIITPIGRVKDTARARAAGEEVRSVIAGYHWFTDWGRDTMISLEGLTLTTGRHVEAAYILRTFAHYVRDGLIPNLFPEGRNEGLYHTADATLWFFHAVDRFLQVTGDRSVLRRILPKLEEVVEFHLRGTRFGIHVDPADGLLAQGAEGYQLTWMDAKVDGWVVTPRRGKAVELNGLWYNALRLFERWLAEEGRASESKVIAARAEKARASFNARFWNPATDCLFDVVDAEGGGNDGAIRPNQLLSFSLANPVLDETKWRPVLEAVHGKLLTPVGLRSLSRDHPDYKASYDGDLRVRDAAYHQGTVWSWLIGPFIDAWLKVHPADTARAREFLEGFVPHLGEACIGSISEIFDAEPPYTPRGCIAQAWGVAEMLRCWVKVAQIEALNKGIRSQ
jgi:predicted glycogen debranching enzyme